MRTLALATAAFFSGLTFGAEAVMDTEVGTVRAFQRTVTVDLDECRKDFTIFGLPLPGSRTAQASCRVALPNETLPATVQTTVTYVIQEMDGGAEKLRLTFEGNGLGYGLRLWARDGIANWTAAEKQFRRLLDEKVNGGRYETIVTKVVLGK